MDIKLGSFKINVIKTTKIEDGIDETNSIFYDVLFSYTTFSIFH